MGGLLYPESLAWMAFSSWMPLATSLSSQTSREVPAKSAFYQTVCSLQPWQCVDAAQNLVDFCTTIDFNVLPMSTLDSCTLSSGYRQGNKYDSEVCCSPRRKQPHIMELEQPLYYYPPLNRCPFTRGG
jgi:hypothetical protein